MVIYWNTLDVQVRIRVIRKIPSDESDQHFNKRTKQKMHFPYHQINHQ